MRFSEEEKKGMNAWANALGADVPTLYSVEKAEESLEACLGNPTSRYEGYMSGTPLFANDIGVAIAHVSETSSFISQIISPFIRILPTPWYAKSSTSIHKRMGA